ncbi:hypothetical protein [Kitasatospora sp. GP82]|uniref:hypothetical protein n=1 Tax=Kitasatospora sp. GP82 TaxID=3035089 RepID=UPI002475A4A9|nr:hypothetical protein [Kitasatospora sp. GP82]MDH6125265.1 hypothetical protein [Kitasatospora sp. GP82]
MLDVMVATVLGADQILRGARRSAGEGGPTGFAWGRLPADGSLPEVAFTSGLLSRSHRPVYVVPLAEAFWLAWSDGPPCTSVRAQVHRSDVPSIRLRAGRAS